MRHRFATISTTAGLLCLGLGLGCGGRPEADEVVPLAQVPAPVMEAARRELPGLTFDKAYKLKVDGRDAYEVRGKDARGKVREVEVSATGEVLAVE